MGFSSKRSYSEFEPIREGDHVAQLTKCVLTKSRKGDDMLAIRWTIVGENDPQRGRTWRDYIVLKPTSWGYGKLSEICSAVGIQGCEDDPDGLDPHEQMSSHKHLIGIVVTVKTSNESSSSGDGKTYINTRSQSHRKATWTSELPELPHDAYLDFEDQPIGMAGDSSGQEMWSGDDAFSDSDVPF